MKNKKNKKSHKLIALFLTLVMCLGVLSTMAGTAFASTKSKTKILIGGIEHYNFASTFNSLTFGTLKAGFSEKSTKSKSVAIKNVNAKNGLTIKDYYITGNDDEAFRINENAYRGYELEETNSYINVLNVVADAAWLKGNGEKTKTYKATLVIEVSPKNFTLNDTKSITNGKIKIPLSVKVKGKNDRLYPAVKNVQAEPGNGYVNLTWDPVKSNVGEYRGGYVIYRSTDGGEYEELNSVGGGEGMGYQDTCNAYTDHDVTNGKTYSYKVAAIGHEQIYGGRIKYGEFSNATKAVIPGNALKARLAEPVKCNCYSNDDGKTATYGWRLYDKTDNGSGTIDHFIVYRDGTPIMEVPQSACIRAYDDYNELYYYWQVTVPVYSQYQESLFTAAAVSVDNTVGMRGAQILLNSVNLDDTIIKSGALRYENMDKTGWGVVVDLQEINFAKYDGNMRIKRNGKEITTDTYVRQETREVTYHIDRNVERGKKYVYEITLLDNNNNETGEAQTFTIKIPSSRKAVFTTHPVIDNYRVFFGYVYFDYSAYRTGKEMTLKVYRNNKLIKTTKVKASNDKVYTFRDTEVANLKNGTYKYCVKLTESDTKVTYTSSTYTYIKGDSIR